MVCVRTVEVSSSTAASIVEFLDRYTDDIEGLLLDDHRFTFTDCVEEEDELFGTQSIP